MARVRTLDRPRPALEPVTGWRYPPSVTPSRPKSRSVVIGMCALALLIPPAAVEAQPEMKVARVSYLSDIPASLHAAGSSRAHLLGEFREGLRDAGYIEKKTSPSTIASRKGRWIAYRISPLGSSPRESM
jgi:hypothetical protein